MLPEYCISTRTGGRKFEFLELEDVYRTSDLVKFNHSVGRENIDLKQVDLAAKKKIS